jgi:hypothetical protein
VKWLHQLIDAIAKSRAPTQVEIELMSTKGLRRLADKQAAALQVDMKSEQWPGRARRQARGAKGDGIRRKKRRGQVSRVSRVMSMGSTRTFTDVCWMRISSRGDEGACRC